ncbi:MAG: ABC transporter permease [Alphaproteobacteria bacterium]|nr:ABC transporter permease [Alphaproteobacteria bacterium]
MREPISWKTASSAARVQLRCISALMVRDMMMRYGRENIGFLWIVLEPILLTAGVMVLWSFIKSGDEHGIGLLTLVMTGYLPLTLWRHISQAGVHAFRRSRGLLYHRHITLMDSLLSRLVLEFVGTSGALFLVYAVLALAGAVETLRDPGLALLGWVSMGVLSLGVAVCFAVITEYSEVSERFIQPLQYINLPISGAFFVVAWLPKAAADLALYNPSVHCYEMFRAGFIGDQVTMHYTPWYPAACGFVLLFFGLHFMNRVRDRLHFG